MALPMAGATLAHATSQALSMDEGEAGTTSSRPAVSSTGLVQIPMQWTNMPNISEHSHQPFSHTKQKKHQKFLQFYWRNQLLQFTCLSFRLGSASLCIHKTTQPCSYLSEGQGNSLSDVSGRHADIGENGHGAESQFCTRETSRS